MEDATLGGCGNDFALDDITLRECVVPMPIAEKEIKYLQKPIKAPANSTRTATIKKISIKRTPAKIDSGIIAYRKPSIDTSAITHLTIKEIPFIHPVPDIILRRDNPLIKQIETEQGQILIELFDNGQVDGDTVSVYHNNELIVARAGLSHNPVSFHLNVDTLHHATIVLIM